jgi:glycosyltransferase involved in cell wall biosynthesis
MLDKFAIDVSIIGPAMNEGGNLEDYVARCFKAAKLENINIEIIIINDGSTDNTGRVLQSLVDRYPNQVIGLNHQKNLGLTQALCSGFSCARGEYIIWISTDLESYPDEDIPKFMAGFRQGADVVAGYRLERQDGKNIASKIYNTVCKKLFSLNLKDMNWTKGFHRKCLPFLELRGDWHRFILVMLHKAGFKIIEKPMQWYPRTYGQSKFGIMRFPRSFVDSLSVWFLFTFSQKPMRLFGSLGAGLCLSGLLIHGFLIILYWGFQTQMRPVFWGGLTAELLGVQLILIGFVSELIGGLRYDLHVLQMHVGLVKTVAQQLVPAHLENREER